jgi:hypothetical protein
MKIINPRPTNLKFGLFFSLVFSILFVYLFFNDSTWKYLALASALTFLFLAIFKPVALTLLNEFWFKLGSFLGKIVSPLVLGLIFLTLFTPIAIIMRLSGRDELKLKKVNAVSYWIDRKELDPDSFKNQF